MFDELISEFPLAAKYLANDSSIVRCPDFENAISLIQEGKESELSIDQRSNLYKFHTIGYNESEPECNSEDLKATLSERKHKRPKTKASGTSSFLDP